MEGKRPEINSKEILYILESLHATILAGKIKLSPQAFKLLAFSYKTIMMTSTLPESLKNLKYVFKGCNTSSGHWHPVVTG